MIRERTPSVLHDAYCDLESAFQDAMRGNGSWPLKIDNGSIVTFFMEGGESLHAKVSTAQAERLSKLPGFEVVGFSRAQLIVPPVVSWIEEGERLARERKHGSSGSKQSEEVGGVSALLSSILSKAQLEELALTIMNKHIQDAAERRAEPLIQAQVEAEVKRNAEFSYGKLQALLTPDDALDLLNQYAPEFDAGSKQDSANYHRLSEIAPLIPALAVTLRSLQEQQTR